MYAKKRGKVPFLCGGFVFICSGHSLTWQIIKEKEIQEKYSRNNLLLIWTNSEKQHNTCIIWSIPFLLSKTSKQSLFTKCSKIEIFLYNLVSKFTRQPSLPTPGSLSFSRIPMLTCLLLLNESYKASSIPHIHSTPISLAKSI